METHEIVINERMLDAAATHVKKSLEALQAVPRRPETLGLTASIEALTSALEITIDVVSNILEDHRS